MEEVEEEVKNKSGSHRKSKISPNLSNAFGPPGCILKIKMETDGFFIRPSEYSLSKVDILRGIVTEKMTTAVREILAVVEKTVVGYEDEVSSLKRELDHHKKQLDAILQPQVNLYREVLDNAVQDISFCHIPRAASKKEENFDLPILEQSSSINENNIVPMSEQEMESLEHEDGDNLENLPNDSAVEINENECNIKVNNTQSKNSNIKRRKRLPRRYISSQTESDTDEDENICVNEWRPRQNKKSANGRKQDQIKLRIALLNCSDAELSKKAFRYAPVKLITCERNLSESAFLNLLRATFRMLRENPKPFEAFLYDSRNRLPLSENGMTPTELYKAFISTEKRHFAFHIKLKEHEYSCDTMTNPPTTSCDKNEPSTRPCNNLVEEQPKEQEDTETAHVNNKASKSSCNSLMEEQPSETNDLCKSVDEPDDMLSVDSAAQSEDDEDDDWKPEQNNEEEIIDAPKSAKKTKARSRKTSTNFDTCKVCGILFKSENILTKHVLNVHVDNSNSLCGVCGQQLQSSEELRSHLNTHQKLQNLHQCETCGQYLITILGLQRHMVTHVTEKLFKCHICQKAFADEKLLRRHERGHNDKPYKCDTCPQAFIYKSQLDTHNKVHTGEKTYCCEICGKSMSDFRSFSYHKQSHMGQRNYSCQHCGRLFPSRSLQREHEKIHTNRGKNYLCDICSKSFYSLFLLKRHKERHEEKHINICPVCNKPIKGTLKRHMRIHTDERPFSCSMCGSKFRQKAALDEHLKSHKGIKPFTCKVCGKACGRLHHLELHMRTHTGEKPYKCTLCDKAFTQSHCLNTHMKIHQGEQGDSCA